MLPALIAGAVGALGFTGYKLARECSHCKKRLKWTNNCLICEKVICRDCSNRKEEILIDNIKLRQAGHTCIGMCSMKINQRDEKLIEAHDAEQERRRIRISRISRVRLVSANYSGPQNPTHGRLLETDWFEEKYEAEESARQIAVDQFDADNVWYVKTISQKNQGISQKGRIYYYRVWKVTGEV